MTTNFLTKTSTGTTVNFHIYLCKKKLKKSCTIVFLALELVVKTNCFLAVGHKTRYRFYKSVLKYIYLGWEEIQY